MVIISEDAVNIIEALESAILLSIMCLDRLARRALLAISLGNIGSSWPGVTALGVGGGAVIFCPLVGEFECVAVFILSPSAVSSFLGTVASK